MTRKKQSDMAGPTVTTIPLSQARCQAFDDIAALIKEQSGVMVSRVMILDMLLEKYWRES